MDIKYNQVINKVYEQPTVIPLISIIKCIVVQYPSQNAFRMPTLRTCHAHCTFCYTISIMIELFRRIINIINLSVVIDVVKFNFELFNQYRT